MFRVLYFGQHMWYDEAKRKPEQGGDNMGLSTPKEKDQLFSNMLRAALGWLQNRSPEQIAINGNIVFENGSFCFQSLGEHVTVSYPGYDIAPRLDQWHILTILHYLSGADGTPLSGEMIAFSQHKDGLARGMGFDRNVEEIVSQRVQATKEDEIKEQCLSLGAKIIPSNADLCAEFRFMPNYPVWLKIWFEDDEFPASGRMFLDASAQHYLSIEDAVTVGTLILNRLFA